MKDIDIYFLSLTSKIPEILSAALGNYVVLATLHYDGNPRFSTFSTLERLQQSYDLVRSHRSDERKCPFCLERTRRCSSSLS